MGASEPIRVLVIDDSEAVLNGIASILRDVRDIEVFALLTNGLDAVRSVEASPPDVALVDSQMPALDGVAVTREIKARMSSVGVILMAVHPDCIDDALEAGADGYLVKDSDGQELADAIRRIAHRPRP